MAGSNANNSPAPSLAPSDSPLPAGFFAAAILVPHLCFELKAHPIGFGAVAGVALCRQQPNVVEVGRQVHASCQLTHILAIPSLARQDDAPSFFMKLRKPDTARVPLRIELRERVCLLYFGQSIR